MTTTDDAPAPVAATLMLPLASIRLNEDNPNAERPETFNALVRSYSAARESWLTYRGAVATNTQTDQYLQQLNQNLLTRLRPAQLHPQ